MNKYVYYLSISLLTLIYTIITTSLIDYKSDTHRKVINTLLAENDSLKMLSKLSELEEQLKNNIMKIKLILFFKITLTSCCLSKTFYFLRFENNHVR